MRHSYLIIFQLFTLFNLSLAIPSIFNLQNYFQKQQYEPHPHGYTQGYLSSDPTTTSPVGGPAATGLMELPSSSPSFSSRANRNRHAPYNVEAVNSDSFAAQKADEAADDRKVHNTQNSWMHRLINGIQSPLGQSQKDDVEFVEEPLSMVDISQYEDEVVLRFNWSSTRDHRSFRYATETLVLDVWAMGKDYGDVRIARSRVRDLLKLLPKQMRGRKTELISDLQMSVFANYPLGKSGTGMAKKVHKGGLQSTNGAVNGDWSDDEVFFSDYRNLENINLWLDSLASRDPRNSELIAIESIGKSHQGRDVNVVHIRKAMIEPKPVIVIVSGVQGREWSSIMTGLYSISQILNNHHNHHNHNDISKSILDQFDFLFVPILNPDGYVYTWEYDRLWRKNRQPTGMSICSGIDIDHSFAYNWQQTTECTPCSETYGGTRPHEALEALHLSNYLNATAKRFDGYLQFGSYSQTVLFPRGRSVDEYEESKEFAEDLVSAAALAMTTTVSSQPPVPSVSSDGSHLTSSLTQMQTTDSPTSRSQKFNIGDLTIHRNGARGGSNVDLMRSRGIYALEITVPSHDDSGFLLPKKHILSASQEMYAVVKSYCDLISVGL
ncbi:Ecm14p [Sugiyamaella lignohabitans]|uniref:Inactive metallocarboxypeptidase ECM14 n=1 Tax=Sugiyamaella lignohabitans TaxID=796027 RepID=A0A167DZV3_9ASCO|nr:Ecm14p [Sugiyamaella lignohabitans]ANB13482.1 Ecm14p [Sugiyamaella lignohabitans]